MTQPRDWKPVRRGEIYCSPACGCRCTFERYEAAVSRAQILCERLGEGWEPKVWENVGWHFAAYKGVAHVHGPYGTADRDEYKVYVNTRPQVISEKYVPLLTVKDEVARLVVFALVHAQKTIQQCGELR